MVRRKTFESPLIEARQFTLSEIDQGISCLIVIFVFFLAEKISFHAGRGAERSGMITSSLSFNPVVMTWQPSFVRFIRNLRTLALESLWTIRFSSLRMNKSIKEERPSCPQVFCIMDSVSEATSMSAPNMKMDLCFSPYAKTRKK